MTQNKLYYGDAMNAFYMGEGESMIDKAIYCCGCNDKVTARLTDGNEIYPHRPDLANKAFWKCDTCKNYVGCHPGGNRALGNIPTPELRKARSHIHALIDPLWKDKKIQRRKLYNKISERIGWEYHTAKIRNIKEARDIYRIGQKIARELTS